MVSIFDVIKQQQRAQGQNKAFQKVQSQPKSSVFDIIKQRKANDAELQEKRTVLGNVKVDGGTFKNLKNTNPRDINQNLLQKALPSLGFGLASAEESLDVNAKALSSTGKTQTAQNAQSQRKVKLADPINRPSTFINDISASINSFLGSLFK